MDWSASCRLYHPDSQGHGSQLPSLGSLDGGGKGCRWPWEIGRHESLGDCGLHPHQQGQETLPGAAAAAGLGPMPRALTAPADALLHGGAWTSSRHMGSLAGYGCEVRNVCGLRQEIPSPPSRTPQGPLALRVSPRGTAVTRWTLHAPPCCPRRRPGQSLSWAPPFPAAVKSRAAA